jgi:hypothetical protein
MVWGGIAWPGTLWPGIVLYGNVLYHMVCRGVVGRGVARNCSVFRIVLKCIVSHRAKWHGLLS